MAVKTEVINIEGEFDDTILGIYDSYLKKVKNNLNINIHARKNTVTISGEEEDVKTAANVINSLIKVKKSGKKANENFIEAVIMNGMCEENRLLSHLNIYPRTEGQRKYIQAIFDNDIIFVTGPAGTGKTYLAVACGVNDLLEEKVKKIVLVRPAVEAGEKLGFLPGDLQEKVNPYLIPIYDALYDILPYEKVKMYMERGIIEVIPIAFMRGRTFHNSFIIMDEGQNTSKRQMLMFLTRMGEGSRVVVTGDITQVDLPEGIPSGMLRALSALKNVDKITFIDLKRSDIIRHKLVKEIVKRYTLDSDTKE